MARRMPTAAEYRNAQLVTGMRDVDIADVRDITRRGLKAPAPARKRGKVRSRKKIVTQAKPKATPAQKVAKLKAAKPDSRPTPDEMDVLGRAGQNASTSNKPLAVKQKVRIEEHGGMSANDAPQIGMTDKQKKGVQDYLDKRYGKAPHVSGHDWRDDKVYNPRKDPDIQRLMKTRQSSEIKRDTKGHARDITLKALKGPSTASRLGAGAMFGIAASDVYNNYRTKSGKLGKRILNSEWYFDKNQKPLVRNAMEQQALKKGIPLAGVGAFLGDAKDKKKNR